MKKLILCLVIVLAAFTAFGCADDEEKTDQQEQQQEEAVSGGWEMNTDFGEVSFPKGAQDAFNKYTKAIKDELVPAAYIGFEEDKEDNEKTYEFMAYNKTDKELQAVSVEINANGDPDIGDMQTFDISKYTEGDGAESSTSEDNDFAVPEDYAGSTLSKEAKAAFDGAVKELDGNALTPLACLGTQVVNGTNYAILCESETVTAEPVKNIQLVVVNQDSSEKCSIVNINTLNLEAILQESDDDEEDD